MASTITSAFWATLTAAAICFRSSSGSLATTSSICQAPPNVILQPSLEHLNTIAYSRFNALQHGNVVFWYSAVTAEHAAIRIRTNYSDGLDLFQVQRCEIVFIL